MLYYFGSFVERTSMGAPPPVNFSEGPGNQLFWFTFGPVLGMIRQPSDEHN
uniref:Uncharacterized protein n=1 Tax=Arundo donax TaxID=35708 RepID=A0A0A9FJ17_ARUDO